MLVGQSEEGCTFYANCGAGVICQDVFLIRVGYVDALCISLCYVLFRDRYYLRMHPACCFQIDKKGKRVMERDLQ